MNHATEEYRAIRTNVKVKTSEGIKTLIKRVKKTMRHKD